MTRQEILDSPAVREAYGAVVDFEYADDRLTDYLNGPLMDGGIRTAGLQAALTAAAGRLCDAIRRLEHDSSSIYDPIGVQLDGRLYLDETDFSDVDSAVSPTPRVRVIELAARVVDLNPVAEIWVSSVEDWTEGEG
jgi:hypothetical protein